MSGLSTVGTNYAVDIATGRAAGPGARTTYLALATSSMTKASTLATAPELSTAGYARQAVTWSAPTGANSTTTNSAQLTFGPLTAGSPGTITDAFLASSSSGTSGDLLAFWTLDVTQTPGQNGSIQFPIGNLSLSNT